MIEARFTLIITGEDDDQIDDIIQALLPHGKTYPEYPIISIGETSRERRD